MPSTCNSATSTASWGSAPARSSRPLWERAGPERPSLLASLVKDAGRMSSRPRLLKGLAAGADRVYVRRSARKPVRGAAGLAHTVGPRTRAHEKDLDEASLYGGYSRHC